MDNPNQIWIIYDSSIRTRITHQDMGRRKSRAPVGKFFFFTESSDEVARRLTSIDLAFFLAINPDEFLDQVSTP